jgi:hypothetical protein
MRMELLATSVLLVILDGIPAVVHIDEPRHGVQFGVDENSTSAVGTWAYELTLRPNAATGDLSDGNAPPVAVPFRPNAPGVIDISSLQTTIGANSPSSLALQLIRLPYRQVFGPTPPPSPLPTPSEMFATAFEPSVTISEIRSWPDYATNVSSEGAP